MLSASRVRHTAFSLPISSSGCESQAAESRTVRQRRLQANNSRSRYVQIDSQWTGNAMCISLYNGLTISDQFVLFRCKRCFSFPQQLLRGSGLLFTSGPLAGAKQRGVCAYQVQGTLSCASHVIPMPSSVYTHNGQWSVRTCNVSDCQYALSACLLQTTFQSGLTLHTLLLLLSAPPTVLICVSSSSTLYISY